MSHETIYRSLFVQARVLGQQLLRYLDEASMRRSAPVDPNGDRRGMKRTSSQSVSDRPRLKIERCLAIGRKASAVRAEQHLHRDLVERQTRYVMLASVAGKEHWTVVTALITGEEATKGAAGKSLTRTGARN